MSDTLSVALIESLRGSTEGRRLLYVAGVLAKMQRDGECSRDFMADCTEPIMTEHLHWAHEVIGQLEGIE